jgi:hypothetical protein
MKELYLLLKAYLEVSVPALKHVRLWNNQLVYQEAGTQIPFAYPAVFIEFQNVEYTDLQNFQQSANMDLVLHICNEVWNTSSQEEQLDIFDLKDDIFKAISQIKLGLAGNLTRTREFPDIEHTNIYHLQQHWSVTYAETSANRPTQIIEVLLDLTKQIEISNYDLMTKKQYGS